jgi:hypothetical protein
VNKELSKNAGGKLVGVVLSAPQSVNTQRSIRPQAVALWLLAALFGVIGLLIVGQLLARLSFLEAGEYGTLRALGMSRRQLMTGCLGRAVVIGAAGGLIGAVLGVALSPLLPVGLARVAEPHPGIDADVPVLAVGLAAAVLVTAGCAAWPGWRATAERPLSGPGRDRRGVVSRLAATGPVPLAMGIRLALHRGAGRTAVPVRSAVASAAVGVAALSAAIVFAGSLSHLLASPVLYGVTWDAVVGNDADTDMRPVVAAVRHDRQVAAWTAGWAGLPLRAGRTEFDAIALPVPAGASFVPQPVTGRLPRTSREIALGTRTLRQLHARIGTTIQVSAPLFNIPGHPMTIVGTTVFPTMSDTLGLGTGAALTPGGLQYLLSAKTPIPPDSVFVRPQGPRHAARPGWLVQRGRPSPPHGPAQLRTGARPAAGARHRPRGDCPADHRAPADDLGAAAAARLRDLAGARIHLMAGPRHALLAGTHAGRDRPGDRRAGRDRVRQAVLAGLRAPARHHPGGGRAARGTGRDGGRLAGRRRGDRRAPG